MKRSIFIDSGGSNILRPLKDPIFWKKKNSGRDWTKVKRKFEMKMCSTRMYTECSLY